MAQKLVEAVLTSQLWNYTGGIVYHRPPRGSNPKMHNHVDLSFKQFNHIVYIISRTAHSLKAPTTTIAADVSTATKRSLDIKYEFPDAITVEVKGEVDTTDHMNVAGFPPGTYYHNRLEVMVQSKVKDDGSQEDISAFVQSIKKIRPHLYLHEQKKI